MDLTGIGSVADLANTIIQRVAPDKAQQEKDNLSLAIQELINEADIAKSQSAVNANEANALGGLEAGASWFQVVAAFLVAGWRPAFGWMGAAGFFVQFVVGPICSWVAALEGHPVPFPTMDWTTMAPIIVGILGLGGMRSYDKKNGTGIGA